MIDSEVLNKLTDDIEIEIHATHSISDSTYMQLQDVISTVGADVTINVRDSRLALIASLNPLSFKMFQYMIATMEEVMPEIDQHVIKHVANVVLAKAFKFFPNNTAIYIAYAMRRVVDDRDMFVHECMKDKIINVENKSTQSRNYGGWLLMIFVLVVITAVVAVMRRMYINKDIVDERKEYNKNAGINYKVIKDISKEKINKLVKEAKKGLKGLKALKKEHEKKDDDYDTKIETE